jgi:hypothetical protein
VVSTRSPDTVSLGTGEAIAMFHSERRMEKMDISFAQPKRVVDAMIPRDVNYVKHLQIFGNGRQRGMFKRKWLEESNRKTVIIRECYKEAQKRLFKRNLGRDCQKSNKGKQVFREKIEITVLLWNRNCPETYFSLYEVYAKSTDNYFDRG